MEEDPHLLCIQCYLSSTSHVHVWVGRPHSSAARASYGKHKTGKKIAPYGTPCYYLHITDQSNYLQAFSLSGFMKKQRQKINIHKLGSLIKGMSGIFELAHA